jgi:hypothetical protein
MRRKIMKNAMKQVLILALCAVMVLTLCACKSKQAKAVDEQILAIGEVTAESGGRHHGGRGGV